MQVLEKGLDYSAGVLSSQSIKNSNYQFVIRYVGFPGNKKCITPEEYRELISNGITVYAVYEWDTNDAMGGFNGGQIAASKAREDMNRIGFPNDSICFFCADRHLSQSEVPIALEYFKGAASVIGYENTGAYGFQEVIWAIQNSSDKIAKYLWQCGSQSYVKDGVHFYQWNNGNTNIDGITSDINYKFINTHQDGGIDLSTIDDIFNYEVAREGSTQTGTTTLKATIAWLDNNLVNLQNLIKQTSDKETQDLLLAISKVNLPDVDEAALSKALLDAGLSDSVVKSLLALLTKTSQSAT